MDKQEFVGPSRNNSQEVVPDCRVEWLTGGSAVENILNDGHLFVYGNINHTVKLGHGSS